MMETGMSLQSLQMITSAGFSEMIIGPMKHTRVFIQIHRPESIVRNNVRNFYDETLRANKFSVDRASISNHHE